MRPIPLTLDTPTNRGRPLRNPRTHDQDTASFATPAVPSMSCFLTTESELDASPEPPSHTHHKPRKPSRSCERRSRPRGSRYSQSSLERDHPLPSCRNSPTTPVFAGLSGPASTVSGVTSPMHSSSSSSIGGRDSSAVSSARVPRSASAHTNPGVASDGSAIPQLIMPSVVIPKRRPFTDVGKSLGKLKILVGGQRGTGKSSLIASLAQRCEHIVHVDPAIQVPSRQIAEMHGSTRPRYWWQAGLDCSSSTRRKMSMTDEMLHRNICLVDDTASTNDTSKITEYIESQLLPAVEKPMHDTDLQNLLSSGAEPIVDVVLYLLHRTGPETADIQRITQLQRLTNVIPILARADELTQDEVEASKGRISKVLSEAGADCFAFSGSTSLHNADVFAVSNATLPDHDTMDASTLMSSGYIAPLVSSDLDSVIERLFSIDGSQWLRHAAASKCVRWRRQMDGGGLHSALTLRQDMIPVMVANTFGREPFWGRIEFSDWAHSLRQSLAVERHNSPSGENMLPLTRGTSTAMMKRLSREVRRSRGAHYEVDDAIHQDPLGLLTLASDFKQNGRLTLELISSLGLVGCVAAWLIRPDWVRETELRLLPRWCLTTFHMLGTV